MSPDSGLMSWNSILLLRMLMRRLTVAVRILAMVVSRGRVFLRLLMVAVIVVMGRLPVVMRRRLMVRSGIVMVFAGRVLLFLGHGNFLLETTSVHNVSGQRARATSVTNFITGASASQLPAWRTDVSERPARGCRKDMRRETCVKREPVVRPLVYNGRTGIIDATSPSAGISKRPGSGHAAVQPTRATKQPALQFALEPATAAGVAANDRFTIQLFAGSLFSTRGWPIGLPQEENFAISPSVTQ